MTISTAAAARTSRRQILVDALRILAVSFLGWGAGAIVVGAFATGSLGADVETLVIAAGLWAAIPLSILRLVRWRAGTSGTTRERPRTWGIWFVIASLIGSTIIGVSRPTIETWSTLQIWSALFLLTPFGIALDTLPRLIRPAGWTSSLAGTRFLIPSALLGLSLGAFVLMFAGASDLPMEVVVVVGLLSFGALLAFAAGLPRLAFGLIGLLFAGLSFVVQLAWLPVLAGDLVAERPVLIASHIGAAGSLVLATAIIQLFRHRGTSPAEGALVDWLRAEAILPEAATADS